MCRQASIKFYLFEGSKKKGVFPIYMRITYCKLPRNSAIQD